MMTPDQIGQLARAAEENAGIVREMLNRTAPILEGAIGGRSIIAIYDSQVRLWDHFAHLIRRIQ